MEWISEYLTTALVTMSNRPLFPYTSATTMAYTTVLLYGIYIFRPDIMDRSNRISTSHAFNQLYPSYDFIVVGGGSAGCVVANRLSENPRWTVLLLEAGGPEIVETEIPFLAGGLQRKSEINWGFITEPSPNYGLSQNHQLLWPRGRIIGGTSQLNTMIYVRGNRRDYDRWRDLGNEGWGYNDVLPYFKKSENMRIPSLRNSPYHGVGGYLSIEEVGYQFPIQDAIQAASAEIGYGYRDLNGASQVGFMRSQVTLRDGLRDSTAKAFLRPVKNRPNLHISLDSFVTKVLVNEITKTAIGVRFVKSIGGFNISRTVYARKEVILSAGAIQSPQLLMLSGIGPADHLLEKGITPIVNSPGVGQNLQDHVAIGGITYIINNPPNIRPYGVSLVNPYVMTDLTIALLIKNSSGPAYNIVSDESIMFVNSKYNKDREWPDIELYPQSGSDCGDGGLTHRVNQHLTQQAYDKVYKPNEFKFTISISPVNTRPYSRGFIRLRNKNPYSHPLLYPNYYGDPRDMVLQIEGAKIAHNLTQTAALQKYGVTLNPYRFSGCEKYQYLTDEYWRCQALHYTQPWNHQSGTCKMGPQGDTSAVVDSRLRVHGIRHLRVIDASIMPHITTGNTNAPTIMIADKGSDMIKQDWAFQI